CTGIGQFTLSVKPVPLANTPADFILCDDELSATTIDGQNSGINLRSRVDQILGSTQTEADYIVSFHTSATGAKMNTDIITNDTNFTNEAGFIAGNISEQTIYVRVQDRNGSLKCVKNPVSFKIIVNPIPVVSNSISPLAVCDIATSSDSDTRNRIAQNIDLTSKDIEILAGKINHRVAYYATQQDAQDGNEIANPTKFQNITSETNFPADFNTDNPGVETIFFKVFDLGGNQCESIFATFQLLIYPEPNIPINIADYSDCDNTSDSFADDANGINGDISLKNKIPEILVNYQPAEFADFSVTFYKSLTEAQNGNIALAIDENVFENKANNQTIYVRVENTRNTPIACVNTSLSFNINIKPLPSFTVMGEEYIDAPQIVCLNDTPLTLEAENPAATYDYIWTNEAGTTLGTDATLNVTNAGKYTVIANDQSPDGCARKRVIVVKESNIATLLESFITIIDESNNLSSSDNISISIDTLSNDLGPGDYQFALRNDDDGDRLPIIGFQDEPLFENLEGGIYTIIVNDKNGCSPDTTLEVSVIQFPKFFTPNADGSNDTWIVKGANQTFYPNSSINIFNRYGKIVAQVPIDSQGWNGMYQGKLLPSDDYWFNITLIPPANSNKPVINKQGNFSLLRR
ncbi:MAG: T9SS type B sorting domain-containing protein, partial [Gammaproteobacteria bacterium]|nr:T9SS type B sorting domain-containing protein [Gammaproteobacteria bacterium]